TEVDEQREQAEWLQVERHCHAGHCGAERERGAEQQVRVAKDFVRRQRGRTRASDNRAGITLHSILLGGIPVSELGPIRQPRVSAATDGDSSNFAASRIYAGEAEGFKELASSVADGTRALRSSESASAQPHRSVELVFELHRTR